jgi:hypothetical protein
VFSVSQRNEKSDARDSWRRRFLAVQSAYYLLTGLWPLVHLPSFEAITGPKTDDWLVHMVGLLACVIGATLGVAAARGHIRTSEIVVLAAGGALAFGPVARPGWGDTSGVSGGRRIGAQLRSRPGGDAPRLTAEGAPQLRLNRNEEPS